MNTLKLSIVAAAAFAFPQSPGKPPAGCPDPSKCPVSLRAEDVRWEKAVPDLGADGPDLAVVHVNPKTQATQLLIRAPKPAVVTWHWHTANEAITVMKGTFTVECEGKKIELGPGSFTYTPSRLIHRATFSEGCMIAISADGPFDLNWGTAGSGKETFEIEGVPIEAVEVARGAHAPGKKITDRAEVKRILEALASGRSAQSAPPPSGVPFPWVLMLCAGKGGYTHQVWVLESGEWGFGGETRGKSAELPGILRDLAGT